jgi:prevent-host-death family protein
LRFIAAEMPFEIVLAPEAVEDLRALTANVRAEVRTALETHLRHEPEKTSRSRIKRLRGLRQPQYRLRSADVRIFYDISGTTGRNPRDRDQIGGRGVARAIRKSGVRQVPLSEVERDLPRLLREAETEEIVITRGGKPAGVLIGFASEDDWFDYRLENDPRFLRRIDDARTSLRKGRGVRIEDLE